MTENERKEKKEARMKIIKMVLKLTIGGLVELFAGAVTSSVLGDTDGPKAAKIGAKIGGFLVGMYMGDQVSDYICNEVDEITGDIEEIKTSMGEEG